MKHALDNSVFFPLCFKGGEQCNTKNPIKTYNNLNAIDDFIRDKMLFIEYLNEIITKFHEIGRTIPKHSQILLFISSRSSPFICTYVRDDVTMPLCRDYL